MTTDKQACDPKSNQAVVEMFDYWLSNYATKKELYSVFTSLVSGGSEDYVWTFLHQLNDRQLRFIAVKTIEERLSSHQRHTVSVCVAANEKQLRDIIMEVNAGFIG
jgi:hypothetical protein